jgi:hypothetical protein
VGTSEPGTNPLNPALMPHLSPQDEVLPNLLGRDGETSLRRQPRNKPRKFCVICFRHKPTYQFRFLKHKGAKCFEIFAHATPAKFRNQSFTTQSTTKWTRSFVP